MVIVKQPLNSAAREVLVLAEDAARQHKHNYLGTEHLLLGLIISNEILIRDVLIELNAEPKKLVDAIEFIIGRGDREHKGDFKLTKGAEKALKCALEIAKEAGSERIGPAHLFLGLIKEGEGIAAGILESLEVSYELAQAAIVRQRSQRRFDKFTDRARRVLTFAQEEAMRFNHPYIGPEHILLGLLREGEGVAAKVLVDSGVKLTDLRSGVEFLIGRGERAFVGEVGLTSAGKRVIELAVEQAVSLGHHYIGTEHLLLGLLAFPEDNVASQVLKQFGVELDTVRKETIRILTPAPRDHLSGLNSEQRAKIEKAVADSLAAFDQFEVAKDNPARIEFDTIAAELTDTIVKLIKREPGWLGFLQFLLNSVVVEGSRIEELWHPGTVQAKWFRFLNDEIWMPLLIEFSGLDRAEVEKAQEALEIMVDLLAQVKKAKN